ncbi:MAG: UDP-N-acetylmuramate--L-alanine ligase [Ardenticatenaceae bacterium]|nr:UDP-N-acetylmuramate--L-alanine ligase [Ardenticatenaceae bacterium]
MSRLTVKHVHFVGIGGAGLSALARVMLARGWVVSGSDRAASPALPVLARAGASVHVGHSAHFVNGADVVVISSAIPPDNPEVVAAQARSIPVLKRDRWLAEMTLGSQLVAVAGSHGKTTTTAMIALLLYDAGLDPTAVIGGEVPQLGGNAIAGGSDLFVIEADEYDHAFLGLTPTIALVTNVEHDHPDLFEDVAAVRLAFARFLDQVRSDGLIVAMGDDADLRTLVRAPARASACFYGFAAANDWQAAALKPNDHGGTDFVALKAGEPVGAIRLRVPGRHNVLNALGATAVADALDVPMAAIQTSLARFTGAKRRFQPVGTVGRIQIFDDYAHHPSEVRATLEAARQRFGERPIWVVFQPHTFSRLRALLDGFATAFSEANRLIVSDIYAARETDTLGVSAEDLIERVRAGGVPVSYIPTQEEILQELIATLPKDVIVMTLGAGDITSLGPHLRRLLEGRQDEE